MSFRTEIQTTLERLKTVEGELTVKERELREREVQLMAWEKDLQHQMYVSVSMGNMSHVMRKPVFSSPEPT